jgi:hypothetical protein
MWLREKRLHPPFLPFSCATPRARFGYLGRLPFRERSEGLGVSENPSLRYDSFLGGYAEATALTAIGYRRRPCGGLAKPSRGATLARLRLRQLPGLPFGARDFSARSAVGITAAGAGRTFCAT